MPIGPNGEKRPHSTHSAGIMVAKIATGEIEEEYEEGYEENARAKGPVFLHITRDTERQDTK